MEEEEKNVDTQVVEEEDEDGQPVEMNSVKLGLRKKFMTMVEFERMRKEQMLKGEDPLNLV